MESLSTADRSMFLRFVWGNSHLPRASEWKRPFKISLMKTNDDDNHLPRSHSCFFQLELPRYSTYEIMKDRLMVAIHYGSEDIGNK